MSKQISKVSEDKGTCFIAIHPKGRLYAAHEKGHVKQYEVKLDSLKVDLISTASQTHEGAIHEISFNSGGDYFAICCEDGEVALFRHPSCSMQQLLCQFDCPASSLCFDHQKHSFFIIASNERGQVKFINFLKDQIPFEYEANKEGIRCIRYLPIKTNNFRERLFAAAGCDGRLSVFKFNQSQINDPETKENEKIQMIHDFEKIFPRIKGTDFNQRLLFDACSNGKLIAIPGNDQVKFIETESWSVTNNEDIKHNHPINCVKFKPKIDSESGNENEHIIAVSDTNGYVSVWKVDYSNKQVKCSVISQYKVNSEQPDCNDKITVCNVDWCNDILIACGNNGHVYSYKPTTNGDTKASEQTSEQNTEMTEVTEVTEPEKVIPTKKLNKFVDSESDDDFDIDMGEKQEPKKVILRKSIDNDNNNPSPKKEESVSSNTSPNANQNKADSIQNEMAAMAEIFGDDGGAMDTNDDVLDKKKSDKSRSESMSKTAMGLIEAVDITTKDDDMEDQEMADNDNGDDLKDFIVDGNTNEETTVSDNQNNIKETKETIMDTNYDDDYNDDHHDTYHAQRNENIITKPLEHHTFQNGCTDYDDDGQRYLLFNEIGAVIARKPSEPKSQEMNNIIMSMSNNIEQFSYEIEFFDKSKYNRAVRIKSSYEFTKCNMNSYGILLGSEINVNNGQDCMVKYRPIKRNDSYRLFASEKDCEWNYVLPENEECVALACSHKYCIIGTNKRYLRVLSVGGLQTHQIYSLPKNIVNICANIDCKNVQNIIAITFSDLSFWVLDLDHNGKLFEGHCVVTNDDAHIKRVFMVGGQKDYQLVTVDSCNVVRMLSSDFGSIWTVIMDINQVLNTKYPSNSNGIKPKGVWPVCFDHEIHSLMVMELKFLEYPIPSQSDGACLLMEYNVSLPLLNMAIDEIDPVTNENIVTFGNREEAILKKNTLFELEFANGSNNNTKKQQHQKKLMKDYLILFQYACQTNKTVMAYDIAIHFLNTEKALNNAKKIAIHSGIPLLAERLNTLLAEKAKKSSKSPTKERSIAMPNKSNHLGRLRRPTAKLGQKRSLSAKPMNEVTNIQKPKVIGKKRASNPNTEVSVNEPPSKQRRNAANANPFSCGSQRNTGGQRNGKNVFDY